MATFFGMKGSELRKVDLMASREESSRSRNASEQNADVSPEAHHIVN
jgi:hypothetical protein